MKKYFILFFCLLSTLPLAALHSGDEAVDFPRMKWLRGNPVRLLDFDSKPQTQYKVAVFLLVHAPRILNTLNMVESLNSYYKGKVEFCFITADPSVDAETLLKKFNRGVIPFAVDDQRNITQKYMAESILFPHAFVIGKNGKILWNGETVDLGEVLERLFNRTFDAGAAQKIAPLMEEMQKLLRETDERKLDHITKKILELEPGHPGALRIRLFTLENSGRIMEAARLLQSQRKACPHLARLYFTEFDLCMRYPALQKQLPELLHSFKQNIQEPLARTIMVNSLLTRRNNDLSLLQAAVELFNTLSVPPRDQRLLYLTTQAALYAKLGLIDKAIAAQKEALQLKSDAQDLRRQLDYYTGVKALQNKVR